jgi:hypothetical protein
MRGGDVGSSIINGIYSYFIRSANVYIAVDELGELREYAMRVVETERALLYVGRFWVVYVEKDVEAYEDAVRIACDDSRCWSIQLLEPYWVADLSSRMEVITDVSVGCEEWERRENGTVEYICRISYKYMRFRGTVAVTVDPLDIAVLAGDNELKLLLSLVSRSRPLIRPM